MKILKEWMGRYGIYARFYSAIDKENNTISYFLDYKGCRITRCIGIYKNNTFYILDTMDIPARYMTRIRKIIGDIYGR